MAETPVTGGSPLGQADLDKINQALEHVKEGLRQAELAQRAGIDVSQHVAQLKKTQEQLQNIKQVYFPGTV